VDDLGSELGAPRQCWAAVCPDPNLDLYLLLVRGVEGFLRSSCVVPVEVWVSVVIFGAGLWGLIVAKWGLRKVELFIIVSSCPFGPSGSCRSFWLSISRVCVLCGWVLVCPTLELPIRADLGFVGCWGS
jgi:hypothetical protein